MIFRFRKFFFIFLGSLWLLGAWNVRSFADTPVGELPTGMVELKEFRYLVYLYVPPGYQSVKDRSMAAVFPALESGTLEDSTKSWLEIGKKRNMLILVSEAKVRDQDVPYLFDDWFLNVQKTLALRYGVKKTYLIGEGVSAHYTSYLGLKYPERFAAVATLGGSWVGPFAKLTRLSSKLEKQTPFFTAISQTDKKAAEVQATAERMTAQGYDVRLVMLEKKDEEKTGRFREMMTEWFEKSSASHAVKVQGHKKTFKEKASDAVQDFFSMH